MKFSKLELCLAVLQIISNRKLAFNQINKRLLVRGKEVEEALEILVKNKMVWESIDDFEIVRYALTGKGLGFLEYFEKKPVSWSFDFP